MTPGIARVTSMARTYGPYIQVVCTGIKRTSVGPEVTSL